MSTITTKDADDSKHQCAACGDSDDGGGSLKACTACNLVKYCNRTCQVAHRPAHKKACKKRLAELFDERLFKQPPPNEDCPICYLRLPIEVYQKKYQSCCGKILCRGCVHAHSVAAADAEKYKCVFCRSEAPSSDEEEIERMKKRAEANDAQAMFYLGGIGENDTRKAIYHRQLSAVAGNVEARNNLGSEEGNAGNMDRAYKHWMISANDGYDLSMKLVQEGHKSCHVTKGDYAKTTRAYGNSIDEMKSDDRDRYAAKLSELNK
eukprot:scaffold846_cov205-Chaetoceros_neogracile.AAC.3